MDGDYPDSYNVLNNINGKSKDMDEGDGSGNCDDNN